jgi:hypothetical protein
MANLVSYPFYDHVVTDLLRNEGFISQDHIGGFSMKREYANTI